METTLGRWGNSNAVRVPAEACEQLRIRPGSRAEIDVDTKNSALTIRFGRAERDAPRADSRA